jgi:hypothetical protein
LHQAALRRPPLARAQQPALPARLLLRAARKRLASLPRMAA